jgi:hypothetical protein
MKILNEYVFSLFDKEFISHLLQFGKLREINNVCTQETLCLAKENCII